MLQNKDPRLKILYNMPLELNVITCHMNLLGTKTELGAFQVNYYMS